MRHLYFGVFDLIEAGRRFAGGDTGRASTTVAGPECAAIIGRFTVPLYRNLQVNTAHSES